MAVLNLNNLKSGMILLGDVRDLSGRLLLGKGETITDRHLRVFKAWGVMEADVSDEALTTPSFKIGTFTQCDKLPPARREKAVVQAADLFHHNDHGHPLIAVLYHHSLQMICCSLIREDES